MNNLNQKMSSLPGWPQIAEDEVEAVSKVLRSGKINYWTGEEGKQFEDEFAKFFNSRHAVALSNGTVALELALYALGIKAGDEVIAPCRSFFATTSCIVHCGATPILADIDPDSQNITAETIRPLLTPKTKAIIVVHLAGWPCDMDPILELAKPLGIKVIEDCAQAIGAKYKGKYVGTIGDAGAFSFCQDKIVTTGGEGGMLTTDDPIVWRKAWEYKDHGKSYDAVYHKNHPIGFRWLHESFGSNLRMTEMQAAIGRIQLQKLLEWLQLRQRNAAILHQHLSKIPSLRIPQPNPDFSHANYKFYIFIRPEKLKSDWTRDRILAAINAANIPCTVGSCSEMYLEQAFQKAHLGPKHRLPNAKLLGETALMFQIHPTLTVEDMDYVAKTVANIMENASQ